MVTSLCASNKIWGAGAWCATSSLRSRSHWVKDGLHPISVWECIAFPVQTNSFRLKLLLHKQAGLTGGSRLSSCSVGFPIRLIHKTTQAADLVPMSLTTASQYRTGNKASQPQPITAVAYARFPEQSQSAPARRLHRSTSWNVFLVDRASVVGPSWVYVLHNLGRGYRDDLTSAIEVRGRRRETRTGFVYDFYHPGEPSILLRTSDVRRYALDSYWLPQGKISLLQEGEPGLEPMVFKITVGGSNRHSLFNFPHRDGCQRWPYQYPSGYWGGYMGAYNTLNLEFWNPGTKELFAARTDRRLGGVDNRWVAVM